MHVHARMHTPTVPHTCKHARTRTCTGVSCLPSPSCLSQYSASTLDLAQNRHIWLVPLRMTVGDAPDHMPRMPSSCVCARARVCVHACICACVHACLCNQGCSLTLPDPFVPSPCSWLQCMRVAPPCRTFSVVMAQCTGPLYFMCSLDRPRCCCSRILTTCVCGGGGAAHGTGCVGVCVRVWVR